MPSSFAKMKTPDVKGPLFQHNLTGDIVDPLTESGALILAQDPNNLTPLGAAQATGPRWSFGVDVVKADGSGNLLTSQFWDFGKNPVSTKLKFDGTNEIQIDDTWTAFSKAQHVADEDIAVIRDFSVQVMAASTATGLKIETDPKVLKPLLESLRFQYFIGGQAYDLGIDGMDLLDRNARMDTVTVIDGNSSDTEARMPQFWGPKPIVLPRPIRLTSDNKFNVKAFVRQQITSASSVPYAANASVTLRLIAHGVRYTYAGE